ncbi:hypothetical protein [Candidatus Magnetaquicoccus inordinatus]|uniref:hypothetical protein n=1 Tax=Candidatus Magnetaquicoccus inordinatus TaxID=2496818 RepID=UPI00102BB44C|nr:hypothetical protein [Candidatus Magnetaquicoccus inordinatus]
MSHLTISRLEFVSEEQLLERLQQTRLRGFAQALVYEHASLRLVRDVDPLSLYPAQNYVLQEEHQRLHTLYELFMRQGINIFALTGAILFWLRYEDGVEEGPIPLTPPLVEISHEPDGRLLPLINDGMHRVYTAMRLQSTINIVQITNVPRQWPYYAYPLANGWADVQELRSLPVDYVKKAYRDPQNYKDLFRDFNGVFPGIQKQRQRSLQT